MNRTKIRIALAVGLFGLVVGSSAQAASFQLRTPSKGVRALAAPIVRAPNLQVSGNPSSMQAFEATYVGESPAPIAFDIVNAGNGAGSLTLPSFGGSTPGEFGATTDCADVPAGGSCQVTVGFRPTQAGELSASLAIAGNVYQFNGTGVLRAPNLHVTGSPSPAQSFGTVVLGYRATPLTVSVTNSGSAAGTLSLAAFTGSAASDFSADSNCSNVSVNSSCQVTVNFQPSQSGLRSASLLVAGTSFTFSGTGQLAATQVVVLQSGTSYTIPNGVTSITVWAVGAGGGGAGSINVDSTSGGGGGAGGVTWQTYQVQSGQVLSYAVGARGAGGSGSNNGSPGGNTTVTFGGTTLLANGGGGGGYNRAFISNGGSWSGGSSGMAGGSGGGASGDVGGGAGGALGGVNGGITSPETSYTGHQGARAVYPGGLDTALTNAGQVLGVPGAGAGAGSSITANTNNGSAATGFGHGGGGAGYYGGNGGAGSIGGGGGGAAGFTGLQQGGAGGTGAVAIKLN